MNANATATSVVGDFSGKKLEYGDGSVVFSKGVGDYRFTLYRQAKFVRQFKVTRTVGSRFVQMYIGTQTDGPEPAHRLGHRLLPSIRTGRPWLPAVPRIVRIMPTLPARDPSCTRHAWTKSA